MQNREDYQSHCCFVAAVVTVVLVAVDVSQMFRDAKTKINIA